MYLQEDVADRVLPMLAGAMAELRIGDPALLATDVGPVIDEEARQALQRHADRMDREGRLIYRCALPPGDRARQLLRAARLSRSTAPAGSSARCSGRSCTWSAGRPTVSTAVLDEIAATGYALTLGIHSRIDDTVNHVLARLGVGNTYVNRNMIGAVVGVQPFGGERLSGTGPKAGGPRYLHRFATERTVSIDTTAAGGNASLLSLDEADGLIAERARPIRGRPPPNRQWRGCMLAATAGPRRGIRPAGKLGRARRLLDFPWALAGVAQMSRRYSGEFTGFRANCCTNVAAGPRFALGGPIVGLRELKTDCHRKSRW